MEDKQSVLNTINSLIKEHFKCSECDGSGRIYYTYISGNHYVDGNGRPFKECEACKGNGTTKKVVDCHLWH